MTSSINSLIKQITSGNFDEANATRVEKLINRVYGEYPCGLDLMLYIKELGPVPTYIINEKTNVYKYLAEMDESYRVIFSALVPKHSKDYMLYIGLDK